MWLTIILITLICIGVSTGFIHAKPFSQGIDAQIDNASYQYQFDKKYANAQLLLAIEACGGYDFSFKRQTFLDRCGKAIGLAHEHQLGQAGFDDLIYIVCDEGQILDQLTPGSTLSDAVLHIFKACENAGCRIKEIRCNAGLLWVACLPPQGAGKEFVPRMALEIVPLLERINDVLKGLTPPAAPQGKNPKAMRAAMMVAVSIGLVISGVVQCLFILRTDMPFTLDTALLFKHAILGGAIITAVLALTTLLLLGRNARTHRTLINVVLIGYVGAFCTSLAVLRDLNMQRDSRPATVYAVQVLDKKENRGKTVRHYVYVADGNHERDQLKISVSRGFFYQVAIGDTVKITQKPGFFNYRWLSKIEK